MTKFYATQEKMQEVLGAFPGPDRTSARWFLYDYRTLNSYFKLKLTDSLWRGVIEGMNAHGTSFVAGVYFVGCSRDLVKERFFYEVYKELISLRETIDSLQNTLIKKEEIVTTIQPDVEEPVKSSRSWLDRVRAWWFNE